MAKSRPSNHSGQLFLWGAASGFLVSTMLLIATRYLLLQTKREGLGGGWGGGWAEGLRARGGLYAGVLSRGSDLRRSEAVLATWGMAATTTEVFTHQIATSKTHIPTITLSDDGSVTDNSALTQTMAHICDHVNADRYDWFLMTRDDVYVHIINLKKHLMHLDPQAMHVIGQSNSGMDADEPETCSSRGGLVLSRGMMKRVCPRLTQCNHDLDLASCIERISGNGCREDRRTRQMFQRLGPEEREKLTSASSDHMTDHSEGFSDLLGQGVTFVYPLPHSWMLQRLHGMYLRERIHTKGWTLTLTAVSAEELRSQLYLGATKDTFHNALCPEFTDYIYVHQNGVLYPGHACMSSERVSKGEKQDMQQVHDAAVYHSLALDGNVGSITKSTNTILDSYACSSGTNTTDYVIHIATNMDEKGHPGNLTRTRIEHHHGFPVIQFSQAFPLQSDVTMVIYINENNVNYLDTFFQTWKELTSFGAVIQLFFLLNERENSNIGDSPLKTAIQKTFSSLKNIHIIDSINPFRENDLETVINFSQGSTRGTLIIASLNIIISPRYITRCQILASIGKGIISVPLQNHTTIDIRDYQARVVQEEDTKDQPVWLLHWQPDSNVTCLPMDNVRTAFANGDLDKILQGLPKTVDPSIGDISGIELAKQP